MSLWKCRKWPFWTSKIQTFPGKQAKNPTSYSGIEYAMTSSLVTGTQPVFTTSQSVLVEIGSFKFFLGWSLYHIHRAYSYEPVPYLGLIHMSHELGLPLTCGMCGMNYSYVHATVFIPPKRSVVNYSQGGGGEEKMGVKTKFYGWKWVGWIKIHQAKGWVK
jgi:hypothetical protein